MRTVAVDLTDFAVDQFASGYGEHNTLGGGGIGNLWETFCGIHILLPLTLITGVVDGVRTGTARLIWPACYCFHLLYVFATMASVRGSG